MTTIERELESFADFARRKIAAGHGEKSIDELFDQWRCENPSSAQYAENVAAIRASLADFERGERGTIAGEHSRQLKREFDAGH